MFGWSLYAQQAKERCLTLPEQARRCMSQSHYDILKVPQSCSSKDVKEAFINLSKQNHPDKHGNDPAMHERFVRINEAYSVLINPSARRAYDMTLGAKRKLNAPHIHNIYPSKKPYTYKPPSQSTQQQSGSYSSSSGSASSDYFYSSWEKRSKANEKAHNESYYGIKGLKKMSNFSVMLLVLGFTCVGAALQWIAIRAYSKRSHEQVLANSHRLSLIHAMAREKARLYGNEHHLNALKSTLKTTYEVSRDVALTSPDVTSDPPHIVVNVDESCDKCKKCKKL